MAGQGCRASLLEAPFLFFFPLSVNYPSFLPDVSFPHSPACPFFERAAGSPRLLTLSGLPAIASRNGRPGQQDECKIGGAESAENSVKNARCHQGDAGAFLSGPAPWDCLSGGVYILRN